MTDESTAIVIAALIAGACSIVVAWVTHKSRKLGEKIDATNDRLDTGNGVKIGEAVRRVEQTSEVILGNQHLQTSTLAEHGRKLVELTESQADHGRKLEGLSEDAKRHGDLLNDHLLATEAAILNEGKGDD